MTTNAYANKSDIELRYLIKVARQRMNNARGPQAAQAADREIARLHAELNRRQNGEA